MTAVEVLADHRARSDDDYCSCGWRMSPDTGSAADMAAHLLDALKAAGYAVVELPKVEESPKFELNPAMTPMLAAIAVGLIAAIADAAEAGR